MSYGPHSEHRLSKKQVATASRRSDRFTRRRFLEVAWVGAAGVVLVLASLLVGNRVAPLSARKMDSHFMWLGGAGLNFLRALPSLPRRW